MNPKESKAQRKKKIKHELEGMPVSYISSKGSSNKRSVVVSNCEFLLSASASSNTAFNLLVSHAVQPGVATSFPWLSRVAANYEMYRFNRLKYTFQPSCATSTAGHFIMAFDPDVLDTQPNSMQSIMSYSVFKYGSVFATHELEIPPDLLERKLFTRNFGALPANADQKTYDLGFVTFAVNNTGSGVAIGVVSVEYEVELFTPQPDLDALIGESCSVVTDASGNYTTALNGAPENFSIALAPTNSITLQSTGRYIINSLNVSNTTVPGYSFSGGSQSTVSSTNVIGTTNSARFHVISVSLVPIALNSATSNCQYFITKLSNTL